MIAVLSLEESVVDLCRRQTDLIQCLNDLIFALVFLAQGSIARSVHNYRLHTCLDGSLDLLDVIAQEEDGVSRLSQLLGDLGVAASIMLQTSVRRVKPAVDQTLKVLRTLFIRSSEGILNVPEQELLRENAA